MILTDEEIEDFVRKRTGSLDDMIRAVEAAVLAKLADKPDPMAWRENIKSLCDQYAQECVQFALGMQAGSGSMSPIASRAGDTRLALHTAIDCAKPPPLKDQS